MRGPFRIVEDDLSGAATRALLALHLAGMHGSSPPGHVFALDPSGLRAPGVTVWTVREGEAVLAVGALRRFGDGMAEIKSMRTHPDYLRRGAARALLLHMIAVARGEGVRRLSLETGSGAAFEAAWAMYGRAGFVEGGAFGGYEKSGFNRFAHLDLV